MICPLRNLCKSECDQDLYKIIGIHGNHISCNEFKTKVDEVK